MKWDLPVLARFHLQIPSDFITQLCHSGTGKFFIDLSSELPWAVVVRLVTSETAMQAIWLLTGGAAATTSVRGEAASAVKQICCCCWGCWDCVVMVGRAVRQICWAREAVVAGRAAKQICWWAGEEVVAVVGRALRQN